MRSKTSSRPWLSAIRGLLLPVGAVLALVIFFVALDHLNGGQKAESRAQLERAVRRASVACYATEGAYPPSLEYLERHYGVQVGEGYTVRYMVVAENLMPDVTVLETAP